MLTVTMLTCQYLAGLMFTIFTILVKCVSMLGMSVVLQVVCHKVKVLDKLKV